MTQSNLNQAGVEAAAKVLSREFGCSWDELNAVNQIAQAAIAAYLECVESWNDISEAPKDGTKILVSRIPSNGHSPINLVYFGRGAFNNHAWLKSHSKRLRYEPTHFQFLPQPPTTGDSR